MSLNFITEFHYFAITQRLRNLLAKGLPHCRFTLQTHVVNVVAAQMANRDALNSTSAWLMPSLLLYTKK